MDTEEEVIRFLIEEPHEIKIDGTPLWLDIVGGISLLGIIIFVMLMI